MSLAVHVQALTLTRGSRTLFRDLSFRVEAGAALMLEGPNGAGKTSLLRSLAGLLAPSAGTIRIADHDDAEERGKYIGWWGHSDGVKAQLTVHENLTFWSKLYGAGDGVDSMLDMVGLGRVRDLHAGHLSAGQKKRLALARLKLCIRPVWLLDEPLSALDAQGRDLAASFMGAHCAGGGIVIAASHQPLSIPAATLSLGGA